MRHWIMTISIMALDNAECRLCCLSFTLSVTFFIVMLSVIMLNVVMLSVVATTIWPLKQ